MTASQKSPAPGSGHWTVAGAKARLSEGIERFYEIGSFDGITELASRRKLSNR